MTENERIRGSPRLRFTEEELGDPKLSKLADKVEKAEAKAKKAKRKLPTKKRLVLSKENASEQRAMSNGKKSTSRQTGANSSSTVIKKAGNAKAAVQQQSGKPSVKLRFEEAQKKPPSKMIHPAEKTVHSVKEQLHKQTSDANEDGNVAIEAVLKADDVKESALQMGEHAYHAHKLKPYRQAELAEHRLDQANLHLLEQKHQAEHPEFHSNPLSRYQQKRAIRRQYTAEKAGKSTATRQTKQSTEKAAASVKDTAKKVVEKIRDNPKSLLILLLAGMLLLVMNTLQACTPMAQSVLQSLVIGTYPATEDDVRAAERAYAQKERELSDSLRYYERNHPEYDAVEIEADEIWHDPYVLIAIISAYYDGQEWDITSAMPVINKYFDLQYVLTEHVVIETRYREEQQTGTRIVTDPVTGQTRTERYTTTVNVPYAYKTCKVKLENKDLSHLPVVSMSHHTMGMYALYMATHGNMEGIFRGGHAVLLRDPVLYDIPQETLDANPTFARLMEEANKYVGYPYVWGGASPETSFDCSGFVSWVFTNSGVYNTGRLGAGGLRSLCRNVPDGQQQPGDIVFFEGTMGDDVGGVTHCGIYVGNGWMIHCGNPIGYANLNDSYWRQHFHSYGRVP